MWLLIMASGSVASVRTTVSTLSKWVNLETLVGVISNYVILSIDSYIHIELCLVET